MLSGCVLLCLWLHSTDVVNLEDGGWGKHTLNVRDFGYDYAFQKIAR